MLRRSLALVSLLVLAGCNSSNETELTIFHTNDIHSHLRTARIDPFGLGGLARLSTLLTKLRAGATNSLTLDAGDYSEGTMYYALDTGANMLRILDAMKYDAACLGNHDFLMGPDRLTAAINEAAASFPVLAANLDVSTYPAADALKKAVPSSVIKTVGGLKIGLIGATTYDIVYQSYLAPVHASQPIDALTPIAKALRPNVDLIVVISHNDFDLNTEIAKAVPGVDVVVSGHSHRKTPQAVMVQNAGRSVPVIEAGEWGKFVGDLKLGIDTRNHAVKIKGYQLHPVTPDLAEDPVVAGIVDAQDQLLNAKIHDDVHRVVADVDGDLIQSDGHEAPLGNLAVRAYRAVTGADLAVEEISLTGVSVKKGQATLMDLHDVVPHIYDVKSGREWKLWLWSIRGSDLKLLFDVFYTVNGLMPLGNPLGWLSADNVQIVWEPSASMFQKLKSVTIGGQPLDPNKRYSMAISDGMLLAVNLANHDFNLGVDMTQMVDTGIDAPQAVVQYGQAQKKLSMSDLRVGGHVLTETADLAVMYYGIDWDGSQLSVEVENQGLAASGASVLTCYSGQPNDFVNFATDHQVWTEIGQVSVGAIAAGGTQTVTIPWSRARLASGYWPVHCAVALPGESYTPNNGAERVFRNE